MNKFFILSLFIIATNSFADSNSLFYSDYKNQTAFLAQSDYDIQLQQQIDVYENLIDEIVNTKSYRFFIDIGDFLVTPQTPNFGLAYRVGNKDFSLSFKFSDYKEEQFNINRKEILFGFSSFIPYLKLQSEGLYFGTDFGIAQVEIANDYDSQTSILYSYVLYFGYRLKITGWSYINMSVGPRFQIMPTINLIDKDINNDGVKDVLSHNIDSLSSLVPDINIQLSFEF